jgi:hypothetical protein
MYFGYAYGTYGGEMGLKIYGKMLIYQDNTSTICLTANEGNFIKNRLIKICRSVVKERVLKGRAEVRYQPTDQIVVDMGTKPVKSTVLEKHVDAINMVKLKPVSS